MTRTEGQPGPEGGRAGHRSVVFMRARSQRSEYPHPGQDEDEYIYDDLPFQMEVQEGSNQAEEEVDPEPRRVPPAQPSSTLNRDSASTCSDDWIWSGDPEDQWEQCPIDVPVHMGVEMSSSQGYKFMSDDVHEDASESNPSSCISIISNPMRKRALSESATQTTPRKSAAGQDHRDQTTQWSTPDLDQQQTAEDNRKENTGGASIDTPLLCNSCWCHCCQRPSEHCGPFSCTSPYIWCLGISREEMNAKELPDYIVKSLVAMGVLDPPDT